MKTTKLSALIALSAMSASGVLANQEADLAPIYLDRTAITVDAGYMMDIDNLSVDSLCGGTIGMSYIFNRTEKSAHSIGLTFGVFDGEESNTYTPFLSDIEVTKDYIPGIDYEVQSRFSPSQKISQQIIPIIVSYKYHRNISSKFSAFVGARAGIFVSKTTAKTRIGAETISNYVDSQTGDILAQDYSEGGDYGESSHTSVSPVIGMELGVEYKFAKNWSWYVSGSIDAAFSMDREVTAPKNKNGAEWAAFSAETSKETVVSSTIRTGFSYQF